MKTILITINKKGEQRIEINGAVGTACDLIAKPFEDAAGGKTLSREDKPEYYVENENSNEQQIGGG